MLNYPLLSSYRLKRKITTLFLEYGRQTSVSRLITLCVLHNFFLSLLLFIRCILYFTGFLNNTELKKYLVTTGNLTQDRL